MRDKEYSLEKPERSFRFALLGSSYEMGWGVKNDEVLEAIVEERLNGTNYGSAYDVYELLNFSVGGYSLVQHVELSANSIYAFDPDVVLLFVHPVEARRAMNSLHELVRRQIELPPVLQDFVDRAGIDGEMTWNEARRRLAPYRDEFLRWSLDSIASDAREKEVIPVCVYVPRTDGKTGQMNEDDYLINLAREAGYFTINLRGAYGMHAPESIRLAEWDTHPNALGHRLLADALFRALIESEDSLRMGFKNASPEMGQLDNLKPVSLDRSDP